MHKRFLVALLFVGCAGPPDQTIALPASDLTVAVPGTWSSSVDRNAVELRPDASSKLKHVQLAAVPVNGPGVARSPELIKTTLEQRAATFEGATLPDGRIEHAAGHAAVRVDWTYADHGARVKRRHWAVFRDRELVHISCTAETDASWAPCDDLVRRIATSKEG